MKELKPRIHENGIDYGNGTLCSSQVCAGQLSCSDYGGSL